MWNIKISGKKKAVLLAWANAVGYGEPEIEFESGTEEEYFLSCSISTRHDANPYGDQDDPWDGTMVDLSQYDEQDIREGHYNLSLNASGLKQLTGCLSVDIEMKNAPDDDDNPFSIEYHYANGKDASGNNAHENPTAKNQPNDKELRKIWKWEKSKDGTGYVITENLMF